MSLLDFAGLSMPQFPIIIRHVHTSPSAAQGIEILISPTFYGATSCTIFQRSVANNQ